MRSRLRSQAGFTISELVLVLAVLAGLVAVIGWAVSGMDDETATRDCRTELRTLKAATEQYRAELGSYPRNDSALADADVLDLDESPNWQVVTADEAKGPKYEPQGDRCA